MSQSESLKEVLVIDDDRTFRFLIGELLAEVATVVAEATNFNDAMAAIKGISNTTGVICDLKLTLMGEEGLIILEEAVRLGFRNLILFTTEARSVSQKWQIRFPHVFIVQKGDNQSLLAAVSKFSKP